MKTPEIEHDIPVAPRSKWRPVLDAMRPGDSVVVNFTEESALRMVARLAGITVVARTIKPNRKRVWRMGVAPIAPAVPSEQNDKAEPPRK